jgi:hypothetical protein
MCSPKEFRRGRTNDVRWPATAANQCLFLTTELAAHGFL